MHNYKRFPKSSLGRKVVSVALASSLILLSSANATGLGKLTVLSALGQPLRAEIELTSPDKDEIASLSPRLASVEAFKQSSIDFNPALLSLRFVVEPRGTGYVIRVTSAQAMNEPFVDLLLEMNSSNGKLLREYTFLLDPAELRNSQSAQVASPINVTPPGRLSKNSVQGVQARPLDNSRPVEAVTQRRVIEKPAQINRKANSSSDYQVRRGDTLTKIANEYMGDGISLDQMLLGLYKANPEAFSGENMNRLKSGQILSIPDVDAIRANAQPQSHLVVRAHAADFASYRNKLAGQVADASAQKTAESKQTVSGSIATKIKEVPTASSESLDKLKLSKATPGKVGAGSTMSEEDLLAKDRAVAEANARVKELEKNVGDLQKLLDVKNKDFAEKQSAATSSLPAVSSPASVPAVAASAAVVASAVTASPASAAASTPVKRRVLPPPPPVVANWYDNWSDWLLPLAGLVAILGLSGLFLSRRKKKTQQFDDSVMTGSSMKANSMFGSTGGQSVDTNNSVFNSNFAPSASQLDANEVDPVAEADVYIAYGRDSQAEEILKEALRTQPDRHAVRVKLLEIYFSRKDPRSFERLASELYGMTNGEGEEWAQAASMGVTLEPTNPLYAGGKSQAEILAVAGGFGMGQQTLDELDPEALLGNSLSQDMLDSIGIMDTASGLTDSTTVPELDFVSIKENSDQSVTDIGVLDFDLNENLKETLDTQSNELPIVAPAVEVEPVPEENIVADFGLIDFDFGDIEAPVSAEKEEVEKEEAEIDQSKKYIDSASPADIVAEDLNEIKFESTSAPALPLELDVEKEESDTINPAKDELASTPTFDFDLSGIDLNLGSGTSELDLSSIDGENASFYNAEMATKLDLAVAYQEIGDKEGARELLDEVLKDGTPDQIEKAQKMLLNLG